MKIHAHTIAVAALALLGSVAPREASAQPATPPIAAWDPGTKFSIDPNLPEAPQAGARFGFAVAMSNDVAVIGAPDARLTDRRFNASTNGAGAAFVFKRAPGTGTWTFVQRLIAPTRVLAQTGCSVAIDPTTQDIVVGAWGYDVITSFGGAAFVYSKGSGDTWGEAANAAAFGSLTRVPTHTIAPEDLQAIDQFGFSVAASGGTLAVGCPLSGNSNTGAIYVYERQANGSYLYRQRLTDEAAGANDQLGTKIALDGNLLVAGVQNNDIQGRPNAGSVQVYRRSGGSWAPSGQLLSPAISASAQFGSAVAVRDGADGWIVAGSPTQAIGRTSPVSGNGAAYVFRSQNGGVSWTLDATLLARTDNVNNNFGYAVALSRTDPPEAIVGAPGYETAALSVTDPTRFTQIVNAGAAFAFVRTSGSWALRGTGPVSGDLWVPAATASTGLGRAVAVAPTQTNFTIVSSEYPSGGYGSSYPFQFRTAQVGTGDNEVSGPAPGVLDENGQPSDGTTPGNGGNGTGGTITGGGAPGTGITSGPGAVTVPLSPIVADWGVIKGSAVAMRGRGVFVLQTDGKHSGARPRWAFLRELPAGARYVGTADMNGDSSGDIVFVDSGEVLRFWKRDGLQVLETNTVDVLPPGFDAIEVGDFNGDRKPEVLLRGIVDPSLLTLWQIEGGAIADTSEYELPDGDWTVLSGNFRAAGNPDILIRSRTDGSLRVLVPGDAAGTATFPEIARRPTSVTLAGFGDADGDGQPDIVWQGKDTEIDVMDQDDAGAYFRASRRRTGFAGGTIVNVRDWNDDGTIDFWMRRGKRNYIQYGSWSGGYMYGGGSRDLENAPGPVLDVADR